MGEVGLKINLHYLSIQVSKAGAWVSIRIEP